MQCSLYPSVWYGACGFWSSVVVVVVLFDFNHVLNRAEGGLLLSREVLGEGVCVFFVAFAYQRVSSEHSDVSQRMPEVEGGPEWEEMTLSQ